MNKKCIIISASDFYGLNSPINEGDYVIAADAGYKHCLEIGVKPDLIIGDFDSYGKRPDFENIIQMPVEKDDTDTMHCVRVGIEKGFTEFEIYGGTGGKRADHTIANIQSLLYMAVNGAEGVMYGKSQMYRVIHNKTVCYPDTCKGDLSIFCLDGKAERVTLKGLKYEIENYTLTSYFPIGCSNSFIGKEATISVENGNLILIHDIFKVNNV